MSAPSWNDPDSIFSLFSYFCSHLHLLAAMLGHFRFKKRRRKGKRCYWAGILFIWISSSRKELGFSVWGTFLSHVDFSTQPSYWTLITKMHFKCVVIFFCLILLNRHLIFKNGHWFLPYYILPLFLSYCIGQGIQKNVK